MRMVLTVVALGLALGGCAHDDSSPTNAPSAQAAAPASPASQPSAPSAPPCSSILRCSQQCFTYYPYTTTQALERQCAATGSGCAHEIANNSVLIGQYQACIALPADQVITYP